MIHRLITAVCLLTGVLHFEVLSWDFGAIDEKDGSVWHTFACANVSNKPVVITQVSASCRCVSADYPRGEIAPGEVFEFKARLDPMGLGGPVSRSLTVHAAGEHTTITLKADVVPSGDGEFCRFRMSPALRAEAREVRFGYVPRGRSETRLLRVKNASSTPVELQKALAPAAGSLDVNCPATLGPGEEADVALTFFAAADAPYGKVEMPLLELKASAIVTDDFSAGGKAPQMRLYPSEFRLRKGRGSVTISNEGAADLVIRAVEAGCGIDVKAGDVIAPGKEKKITVCTDAPGAIFIVTNDPQRPYREIRIQPIH